MCPRTPSAKRLSSTKEFFAPLVISLPTPMARPEMPFSVLKVIVAAQFFSSCYFKVELLQFVILIY